MKNRLSAGDTRQGAAEWQFMTKAEKDLGGPETARWMRTIDGYIRNWDVCGGRAKSQHPLALLNFGQYIPTQVV
jgi:hypothetical protein